MKWKKSQEWKKTKSVTNSKLMLRFTREKKERMGRLSMHWSEVFSSSLFLFLDTRGLGLRRKEEENKN